MISVILSGEYFPYYNTKLSKVTKEHIYEQGICCCVAILANKSKNSDIYAYTNHYHHELKRMESSPQKERGYSFFSSNRITDLKQLINRNYDILSGIDEPCLRKKSGDSFYKVTDDIPYYLDEFNIFNHKIPKWLKTFYINPESFILSHTNNLISKYSTMNIPRKLSVNTSSLDMNLGLQETIVDNDILNARFADKDKMIPTMTDDFSEYNSLRFTVKSFTNIKENSVKTNTIESNFQLNGSGGTGDDDIKDLFNIYRDEYIEKKIQKENKQKEKEKEKVDGDVSATNLSVLPAASTDSNPVNDTNAILKRSFEATQDNIHEPRDITFNSDETMEENKEFNKKAADYDYDIFSRKNQRNYTIKSPVVLY
jgi:hypothetical protein